MEAELADDGSTATDEWGATRWPLHGGIWAGTMVRLLSFFSCRIDEEGGCKDGIMIRDPEQRRANGGRSGAIEAPPKNERLRGSVDIGSGSFYAKW